LRGNFSADNLSRDINALGNEGNPFPASYSPTQDACAAAQDALANAGVRPLDSIDRRALSVIRLASCSAAARRIK
jgi:hypothetical protein